MKLKNNVFKIRDKKEVNKMQQEQELSRILTISGDIDDRTVGMVMDRIVQINDEDTCVRDSVKDYVERPIMLFVNTDGGSAYAALALIGIMEMSMTPIHTYAIGRAFSAGLWIVAAGHVRFAHHLATFMYHEVADLNIGKLESQRRQIKENERLMKMMDKFLIDNTSITPEKLDKQDQHDWFFTAAEAADLGVVDYLIEVEMQKPDRKPTKPVKKKPAKS